jgi:23S rRNA (adenine2030-N6)-methyltransferase
MNYRHAFHAGNFADCIKHTVLVWLVRALQRKPTPLFALDTHAGVGRYDLEHGPATRTSEWQKGVALLLDNPPPELDAYLGIVRSLGLYPGSPSIIAAMLRPDDRLACCELHPEDAAELRRLFASHRQVAVHQRDAWEALGALLPPKERRGLVLIDPPFENPQEFAELARGLATGHARFPTGAIAAWYPLKQRAPARQFLSDMQQSGIRDIVTAELCLRDPVDAARMNGCGMLLINPPYRFEQEFAPILAALLQRLGHREQGEAATITRIVDE